MSCWSVSWAHGGYRVMHADGGQEGLRLAREVRPDAITLDVIMPELDGWAVLRSSRPTRTCAASPWSWSRS